MLKIRVILFVLMASLALTPPSVSGGLAQEPGRQPATQQAQNVERVGQIGGSALAVALQGSYAYVGVGPHLVILDLSDPAQPVVTGQTDLLPGVVIDVALTGNYAYVAEGGKGLGVIDVSDPTHPSHRG